MREISVSTMILTRVCKNLTIASWIIWIRHPFHRTSNPINRPWIAAEKTLFVRLAQIGVLFSRPLVARYISATSVFKRNWKQFRILVLATRPQTEAFWTQKQPFRISSTSLGRPRIRKEIAKSPLHQTIAQALAQLKPQVRVTRDTSSVA